MGTELPATTGSEGEASSSGRTDAGADLDRRNARRRAFIGRWGVALACLLAAVIVTVRTHLFFMIPFAGPVSNDEGYLAAMALRMVRGHWLPYVDGVSQRGPILYWLTTIVMRLGGLWSWIPMRVFGLVLALVNTGLTFALAATLFSPMAGGIAALALTYFLTYELNPWDGVGVNGEPLAVMFALGAALVMARLQLKDPPDRQRKIFVAGLLVAAAGLSKQMFLLHGVPIGLWLLLGPQRGRLGTWRERFLEVRTLLAGFAIPYVIVIGIYAATGHLGTFVYYYQKYGRDIFMDPLTRDYIRDKIREQIDRYFTGIAAVGALYFYAIARALRQTLTEAAESASPDVPTPFREASAPIVAEPAATTARLHNPPESYVLLNVPVPGLGLALLPGRRAFGLVALGVAVVAIAVRFVLRASHGIPYTPTAVTRDVAIWLACGTASAIATGVLVYRGYPKARWAGFESLRANAAPWYGLFQMTCAFAGASFTFRFFPHYFVEFFPFACVVIGGVAAESFTRLDADDRPGNAAAITVAVGGVILLAIANSALYRNVRLRRETDRWYQDPQADPIVRYAADKTSPDQSIFVWGFRAETYLSARRYPGSRYVYTVYPSGVVPWFQATHEEEEHRVVPGSREQLLEDLEREQPELVIDAGRSMNGRYMYNYPALRSYLDRRYCFMRYVDGEPVYRRKHGDRCPPADY